MAQVSMKMICKTNRPRWLKAFNSRPGALGALQACTCGAGQGGFWPEKGDPDRSQHEAGAFELASIFLTAGCSK